MRDDATTAGAAWRWVQDARAALVDLADRYPHELTRPTAERECSLTELTDAFSTVVAQLRADPPPDFAKLKRDTATLQTGLQPILTRVTLPTGNDPRVLESALGWPGWSAKDRKGPPPDPKDSTPEQKGLTDRLQDVADGVLARWPTAPSGREPAAPQKAGRKVFDESVRDLRNRADLIRVWDKTRAEEIRTELDARETLTAGRFSRLAAAVSAELRAEPRKRFDADEGGRPLIGWAVPLDDLPALPAVNPAKSNPEAVSVRDAEAALVRWVAVERYGKLNKELSRLDDPDEPGGPRGERFASAAKRYKAVANPFP